MVIPFERFGNAGRRGSRLVKRLARRRVGAGLECFTANSIAGPGERYPLDRFRRSIKVSLYNAPTGAGTWKVITRFRRPRESLAADCCGFASMPDRASRTVPSADRSRPWRSLERRFECFMRRSRLTRARAFPAFPGHFRARSCAPRESTRCGKLSGVYEFHEFICWKGTRRKKWKSRPVSG